MTYFSYFPKIRYDGQISLNLLSRVKVIEKVLKKRTAYYEYIIPEGETADMTAYKIYGDPNLDWLIYLVNEKFDPYYDWPMTYAEFNAFLEQKYGKPAFQTKNDIAFYRYIGIGGDTPEDIERRDWTMSEDTYNNLSPQERSGWVPVYVYDHETQLNDDRKRLRILLPEYVSQVKSEIERLLSE